MLQFEVVPLKIGYEDDYIELTEELAARCAALLLDYSGSTSNVYKQATRIARRCLSSSSSCGSSATNRTSKPSSRR